MRVRGSQRWNHNLQFHRVVLDAVPPGSDRALDVGCGEGTLARALSAVVPMVVGIDVDERSLELARAQSAAPAPGQVRYLLGDVLTCRALEPGSFDVVASTAMLHHLDAEAGLRRLRELTRPGGVVAVVAVARSASPLDLFVDAAGVVANWLLRARRGWWPPPAPTAPPTQTYGQLRRLAGRELPGARYRRHLLFRCSIVWHKPAAAGGGLPGRRGFTPAGGGLPGRRGHD